MNPPLQEGDKTHLRQVTCALIYEMLKIHLLPWRVKQTQNGSTLPADRMHHFRGLSGSIFDQDPE
jgi:hypothetical protein